MSEIRTGTKQRSRIVIIGGSNTDMVVRAIRLPKPGETVLGNSFTMVAPVLPV